MNNNKITTAAVVLLTAMGIQASVMAQSFMLDDFPQAPLLGYVGFGAAAESPWGFPTPPGTPTAPSPLLPFIPGIVAGDGDILGLGPVSVAAPGLPYIASLSDRASAGPVGATSLYQVYYSVDRVSQGRAGTAVRGQNALSQQPADIFLGASTFVAPANIIGTMVGLPAPFAGVLPSVITSIGSNSLVSDESALTLPADASGVLLRPTLPAAALGSGTHNNVDGFDFNTVAAAGVFTSRSYQTSYPDNTFPFAVPTADVFDIAPGGTGFCGFPAYATGVSMGLAFGDVIDAIVVFDAAPLGSAACGGPGAQAGIDGVLFSLAPGSPSLNLTGRNAADVFLSDFSGNFGVYAAAPQLGLLPSTGGSPLASPDNVDAIEFGCLGDLDRNGGVNFQDYAIAAACLGAPGCADLDGNGVTNPADLALIASNLFCSGG